eukprot:CAMPEP_0116873796 /NCGR_PEP_ID=MMETSP0463-20121206/5088_1 /TAXON_ID=181622 /ORGANISM="Strombidinopsis sp, Strain SopsisLIS2011" /LENGTH=67 /DNA_ID=CAMNT_0004516459 /DNA_START=1409 /DNA_END=1612 /DNA_ORIENTATION=-
MFFLKDLGLLKGYYCASLLVVSLGLILFYSTSLLDSTIEFYRDCLICSSLSSDIIDLYDGTGIDDED